MNKFLHTIILCLGICLLSLAVCPKAQAVSEEVLTQIAKARLSQTRKAVAALAKDTSEASTIILADLLDGQLYVRKSDKKLVRAVRQGDGYATFDVFSNEPLETVSSFALKKITTNNGLRKKIRTIIDKRKLLSPDVAVRRLASQNILTQADNYKISFLKKLQSKEPDATVRDRLETAVALKELSQQNDPATQRAAVKRLSGNLSPVVHTAFVKLRDQTNDPKLRKELSIALHRLETKTKGYAMLETVFFGLSLGSVLVLAAIGLAITFGVMGVINMAHGELIMLGAYTTYLIQQLMPGHMEISVLLAIPAAFLVSAVVGICIEQGIIRFLHGRAQETLLATFGVSLVLQQTVRTIFSPLNRSVQTPQWMSGSWEINPIFSLTLNRLYIIFFCLIVFAALFAVLRHTRLGLQVRAVSQNRDMARAMGTRANLVDALTFGLGSGIAGMAGVALSQLTNVGPNLGQAYIVDSFMVVVFGGVGNLLGTLTAGLSLGVINKILEPYSGAVLAKITILVFIILFIQKRPTGLFPQKGRAVEA
jgi:urea transport system permease protein